MRVGQKIASWAKHPDTGEPLNEGYVYSTLKNIAGELLRFWIKWENPNDNEKGHRSLHGAMDPEKNWHFQLLDEDYFK